MSFVCLLVCLPYLHYTPCTLCTYVLVSYYLLFVCLPYLRYTSCTLYSYSLISYLSPCCNWPISIDSINSLYPFLYLVICYFLLSCKFIGLLIRHLSKFLCSLVFMQLKRKWSIVWSSLPQMHVTSPLNLTLWRYSPVLPRIYVYIYMCVCVCERERERIVTCCTS
jgi:hypothetical protein